MITIEEFFMGRDKQYASELTPEIKANAEDMVKRVNALLQASGLDKRVASGWRPAAVNSTTVGAAKRSKHMDGNACDLLDNDGSLDKWCMANLKELERIGLWLEHPSATKSPERYGEGWCHVQRLPPKSNNRVFYP